MADLKKGSDKEIFMLTIFGAMKNKPEVDWDLVASRTIYKDGRSARVAFNSIKKNITEAMEKDGTIAPSDGATPVKTPAKPRVKKEVGSGTNTTPSKVKKTPATPRKPRTPKMKKGELSELQTSTDSFLSNGTGDNGGDCKVEKGEEDEEMQVETPPRVGGLAYDDYDEGEESS